MSSAELELSSRYGVAIFDDPQCIEDGWACEAGGEPVRIYGTCGLPHDVTWVANIDPATFVRKRLSKVSKLRSDAFLRTRVSALIVELGLKESPAPEQAMRLATLLARVMHLAYVHMGINLPPKGSLNDAIRVVAWPEEEAITPLVAECSELATPSYQPVCVEQNQSANNVSLVSLVFHRYAYADRLLRLPMPLGPWAKCKDVVARQSLPETVDWVRDTRVPKLLEVELLSASAEVAGLLGCTDRARLDLRTWMTDHEFLSLLPHVELRVTDAVIGKRLTVAPLAVPTYGVFCEHSFAAGLYCESLWTALTRSLDDRKAQHPVSAWIRSYDRVICFEKARALLDFGAVVRDYGYGRITLEVPSGSFRYAAECALRHGLIGPLLSPTDVFSRDMQEKPTAAQLMQHAMETGSRSVLDKIDAEAVRQAINDFNSRKLEAQQRVAAQIL